MSGLLLEPKEIDRFMVFCQNQAESANGLLKVMEENNMLEVVIKRERAKAFAYAFVANELANTESMTISPEP
ncbi:hypothetical protein KAR91_71325 [Candidatus Pacearchaeota archaeon]|nr:hypothetical protein [Candidatus Pacearchaeota archaeon]